MTDEEYRSAMLAHARRINRSIRVSLIAERWGIVLGTAVGLAVGTLILMGVI